MTKILPVIIALGTMLSIVSCSKDQLPENSIICEEPVVYDDVKSLINSSCAYVGCHNGIGHPDNFNSYEGLEKHFGSGLFESRVILTRDMPPDYATNGPTSLTQEEIDLLLCWKENDYAKI